MKTLDPNAITDEVPTSRGMTQLEKRQQKLEPR